MENVFKLYFMGHALKLNRNWTDVLCCLHNKCLLWTFSWKLHVTKQTTFIQYHSFNSGNREKREMRIRIMVERDQNKMWCHCKCQPMSLFLLCSTYLLAYCWKTKRGFDVIKTQGQLTFILPLLFACCSKFQKQSYSVVVPTKSSVAYSESLLLMGLD